MITPSSPVTGATVSGLTSPTYTFTADTPPNAWSKAYAVTSLGGTQTGVDVTSASRPFTLIVSRPQAIRSLNAIDSNGVLRNVPYNVYNVKSTKGVTPLAGQASKNATADSRYAVPAGSDVADGVNLAALVSMHVGVQWQQSSGLADTLKTGVL